jgi:glycosyltransferase involved in cell wall biosynthesis
VCIPCISKHIPLLERCVGSIYRQIILPKEVVISISSVEDMDKTKQIVESMLDKFRKRLNIKVLYSTENKYAGENRNLAIIASSGDIISMIDADDAMYANRLYAIKRVFESEEDCIGVLHYFTENNELRGEKWNFDADSIKPYAYTNKMHFGHPSFKRDLFSRVKYSVAPRMQDIKFVDFILPEYRSKLRIYEKKLSHYNSEDSTFYKEQ